MIFPPIEKTVADRYLAPETAVSLAVFVTVAYASAEVIVIATAGQLKVEAALALSVQIPAAAREAAAAVRIVLRTAQHEGCSENNQNDRNKAKNAHFDNVVFFDAYTVWVLCWLGLLHAHRNRCKEQEH